VSIITTALLAEGSTDRALRSILGWLLRLHLQDEGVADPVFVDLGQTPYPPKGLAARIRAAVDLYGCDILFVHRDGDNAGRAKRVLEIATAAERAGIVNVAPFVSVVPVRMTEAWLLFDENAIRMAVGNAKGRKPLPTFNRKTEEIRDPKRMLNSMLQAARDMPRGRPDTASATLLVTRLAEATDDFGLLRQLPAFQEMEAELIEVLAKLQSKQAD